MDNNNFGWALEMLKRGHRVTRPGWNGKGMWLVLVEPEDGLPIPGAKYEVKGTIPSFELLPFIAMKTADNKLVPWLASQTDVLAEDWELLNVDARPKYNTHRDRNQKMDELWGEAEEAVVHRDTDALDWIMLELHELITESTQHALAEEEGKPWPPNND